jgi:hypothetical protein
LNPLRRAQFDWFGRAVVDSKKLEGREFRSKSLDGERPQSGEFLRSAAPLSASRQKWMAKRDNTHVIAVRRRRFDLS